MEDAAAARPPGTKANPHKRSCLCSSLTVSYCNMWQSLLSLPVVLEVLCFICGVQSISLMVFKATIITNILVSVLMYQALCKSTLYTLSHLLIKFCEIGFKIIYFLQLQKLICREIKQFAIFSQFSKRKRGIKVPGLSEFKAHGLICCFILSFYDVCLACILSLMVE